MYPHYVAGPEQLTDKPANEREHRNSTNSVSTCPRPRPPQTPPPQVLGTLRSWVLRSCLWSFPMANRSACPPHPHHQSTGRLIPGGTNSTRELELVGTFWQRLRAGESRTRGAAPVQLLGEKAAATHAVAVKEACMAISMLSRPMRAAEGVTAAGTAAVQRTAAAASTPEVSLRSLLYHGRRTQGGLLAGSGWESRSNRHPGGKKTSTSSRSRHRPPGTTYFCQAQQQ